MMCAAVREAATRAAMWPAQLCSVCGWERYNDVAQAATCAAAREAAMQPHSCEEGGDVARAAAWRVRPGEVRRGLWGEVCDCERQWRGRAAAWGMAAWLSSCMW